MRAVLLGIGAALLLPGVMLGLPRFLPPVTGSAPKMEQSANNVSSDPGPQLEGEAELGHRLFEHNCAHCHGDDARGDEGPSLYDLRKSDARITRIIKEGIKGEMPKFGAKFEDGEIQKLIAYLRTLKS